MTPLISVIIPAYNAEKMIGSTLQSILEQDYENIEVIIIDDASTDNTGTAAKTVLNTSGKQWQIIRHNENKGECASRNTGMLEAQGAYIVFIDSDDLVDRDFLSILYGVALEKDTDIAFCGYRMIECKTGEETLNHVTLDPEKIYSGEELALIYLTRKFITSVCAMLFRSDFLLSSGVRFKEGCISGGDTEFIIKILSGSQRVAFVNKYSYVYRLHENMGSRADNVSHDQKVQRSSDSFQGLIRAAGYMAGHTRTKKIINEARYRYLPKYYLKMFNVYSWGGEYDTFINTLSSPEIRSILWSSYKVFFEEPQLFLKTLWLLSFPKMYYEHRRKHEYFYEI